MTGIICTMVGATFAVAATARVAKTITPNGNAQISTAQSKFGGSSYVGDGTSDNLALPTNTSITGPFTIECFVRFSTAPGTRPNTNWQMLYSGKDSNTYWLLYSNFCQVALGGKYGAFAFGSTMTTGTWYHLAFVRHNSDYKIFFNGTDCGAAVDDGNWATRDGSFDFFGTGINYIGDYSAFTRGIIGNIDEFRISRIARYTANFTPTTTPFVNDADTILLIHADGDNNSTTFIDDNGTGPGRSRKVITAVGNAQVSTAQSKFGNASALFDGTGDRLSIPTSTDFYLGTSKTVWTIEGQLYITALPNAYKGIISSQGAATNNGWGVYIDNNNRLTYISGAAGTTHNSTSQTFTTNSWIHWAVVRNGATLKMYVNGTESFSTTSFVSRTDTASDLLIGTAYNISSGYNGLIDLSGYLDEIRISDTVRYTANFTAPTEPFGNDANTLLLLHMNGTNASTTFTDDNGARSAISFTATGNAQLDTAQSKFGGSSLLLDGNGDYLTTGANTNLIFGTSNHTIEGFIRLDSAVNNRNTIIANNVASFTTNWMKLGVDLSGGSYFLQFTAFDFSSGGTPVITSSVALSLSTWYHVALVRQGTEWYMYIDGTQRGSNVTSTAKGITANWNANSGTQIGRYSFDNGTNPASTYYDGWIDSLRISNVARYTTNFVAPDTQFTHDANTVLLLNFNGTDASTTIVDTTT